MDRLRKKGQNCVRLLRRIYIGYGLVHVARPLALLCYSFAGAAVFLFFEKQAELDRGADRTESLREMRRRIIAEMLSNVFNDTEKFLLFVDGPQTETIANLYDNAFTQYERVVILANTKFDLTRRMHWDLGNALVYSWTVITTIGYGHLCPATVGGRVATMIYAIFGIPLMLSVLTDVGKLLTKFMKYPFLLAKMCGRRVFQYCTQMTREQILQADKKDKSTLEIFDLPIPIAICTVIGWIFICSAITLVWEQEWDYLVAFYFFFISLSTIGFGDVVPTDTRYLFLLFGNIMIGLALVSMCINLMQAKLEKINAQAAASAAIAAITNSPIESRSRLDSNKFFDNEIVGSRARWHGVATKDVIVDVEESTRADEASSYRLQVRRPSSNTSSRTQKLEIATKLGGDVESAVSANAGEINKETNNNADKRDPKSDAADSRTSACGLFISQHTFPASDCKIRKDVVAELSTADRVSKYKRRGHLVKSGDEHRKCSDGHHHNRHGHRGRHQKHSSNTIAGSSVAQDSINENDYEEYIRVLTRRELIEQILHESALPKLDS